MTQAQIYIYGIDLGKNWFHLVAMDRMGHVLAKQKLTRSQLKQFISTTPPCRVAFEACPGSQYWGRLFQQAGFEPKIIPAQFVKPYLKSNKNLITHDPQPASRADMASEGLPRLHAPILPTCY